MTKVTLAATPPKPFRDYSQLAELWGNRLNGLGVRWQLAGSLRRRKEWVADADFVWQPNAFHGAELRSQLISEGWESHQEGLMRQLWRHPTGWQLDFWTVPPLFPAERQLGLLPALQTGGPHRVPLAHDVWGSVLLVATGSMQHNIKLNLRARQLRLKLSAWRGLVPLVCEAEESEESDADLISCPTEEAIWKKSHTLDDSHIAVALGRSSIAGLYTIRRPGYDFMELIIHSLVFADNGALPTAQWIVLDGREALELAAFIVERTPVIAAYQRLDDALAKASKNRLERMSTFAAPAKPDQNEPGQRTEAQNGTPLQ